MCALGFMAFGAATAIGESFGPTRTVEYKVDSVIDYTVPISALLLGGDTIISGSGAGIYWNTDDERLWEKVVGCDKMEPRDWYPQCYQKTQFRRLFYPSKLWRLSSTGQIAVFDGWCRLLLVLDNLGSGTAVASPLFKSWDRSYGSGAVICGNYVLNNWHKRDESVLSLRQLSHPSRGKRLYGISRAKAAALDSVGLNSTPYLSAFNPTDSTFWVNVVGTDQILVLDIDGNPLDSVSILAGDWISPPKPKSRIKSNAVWREWESRWTLPADLQYAAPGYMIFQYRTGWQKLPNDSIPLLSTLIWNTDREPVELSVDHRWQLAGVLPDGRIIFGFYDVSDTATKVTLEITRIEP